MNLLKKNQVIVYVIAIMVMAAGYLNYTTKQNENSVQTSMQIEAKDETKIADIGDATLVNSNDIINENKNETKENKTDTTNVENNNNEEIETKETSNNSKEIEYFIKSKLDRDTMYSQMIETYEKILNSNNSLETQKQSATEEIKKINQIKNSIMICENLITTKGFENNVVFVNGNSVSVIIGVKELKQEEVAQIQNIIEREIKVTTENIHIATKKL